MSDWRVARSLLQLREQVDNSYPDRDKSSDGTIAGGEHHQANPNSDHEPHVKDGDMGIVTAMDLTHDPRHGFDSYSFANYLRTHLDARIKYVISNRRIWNPSISSAWRPYRGSNPHDEHVHVSTVADKAKYDDIGVWDIGTPMVGQPDAPQDFHAPTTIRRGSQGEGVRRLQELLGVKVDGDFGPATEAAVKIYQKKQGLLADGVVGYYTWRTLLLPVSTDGVQRNITVSVFGGATDHFQERSAYTNEVLDDTSFYVALPMRFRGTRPRVKVTNISGKSITGEILDVGPWYPSVRGPADPYWQKNARPRAETAPGTNKAGLDISPAMARELGISGMGIVDWEFA